MNLTYTKPIPKTPFWHYLIALIAVFLIGCFLDYLDKFSITEILPALFLIFGIFDMAILQPRREKIRNDLIFDNRVLGFIDGLYIPDVIKFGRPNFDMRRYIVAQLSKAHQLPDNQFLIEYKTSNGLIYSSHTGLKGEHELFALLCIAQYAKEYGKDDLVAWCESKMESARKDACHFSYY